MADQPPDTVAGRILRDSRQRAQAAAPIAAAPTELPPPADSGFATHVYPPVWIGELPTETPEQRLNRAIAGAQPFFLMPYEKEILTTALRGSKLIFRQDGLVAAKIRHREQALHTFNQLMAAFLLCGFPAQAVRDHELAEVSFEEDRVTRSSSPVIASMRTAWGMGTMALFESSPDSLVWTRTVLTPEDVEKAVTVAERLTGLDSPSVVFLLEADTALRDSELPHSYIMSWAVIEDWISAKWHSFLEGRNVPRKRRDKLADHRVWTIDDYLETMNLAGQMEDSQYKLLISLKSKRNSLLHDRRPPDKNDAAKAFETAEALLLQLLPFEVKPFLSGRRPYMPAP